MEVALEVSAIGVWPFAWEKSILHPIANILHSCGIEHVCSIAMLLAIEPIPWEDVLIRINKHPFPRFDSLIPLPIVLALITVH